MESRTLKRRTPCEANLQNKATPQPRTVLDRRDHLEYISFMLTELRLLAIDIREDTLAYLVEMAILEALQASEISKFQSDLEEGICSVEDSI